jgi:integrase
MRAKVSLYARINNGSGTYPYVPLEVSRRGVKLPVEWKGKAYLLDSIVGFYVRYSDNGKRPYKKIGTDPVDVLARYQAIERDHSRVREGMLPLEETSPPDKDTGSRAMSVCAEEFQNYKTSIKSSPFTIVTYMKSIAYFITSCGNKSIDAVTTKDILNYIDWLGTNMKKRKYGHQDNTLRTKLSHVRNFMKHFNIAMPLLQKEWPAEIPKKKEKYSVKVVGQLLQACTGDEYGHSAEDEKDVVHFFLKTGFRNSEATHAQFKDINFENQTINTSHKLEFNWTPKDKGPREANIFIGNLCKRMKDRMKRYNATPESLIFPNDNGKPNRHLDRIIHRIAKRAGIPGRIELHKFRKTFATLVAAKLSIEDARLYLGHSHLETTQDYLAADDGTPAQKKRKIMSMFEGFGN